ncbi:hypothetical protein ACIOG4_38885 [Streptomyces microflavus]|uniref:hypothetical protein n=1 Tax=Streptomyces microflavus TaxID=1919 RepID=UPI003449F57F
MSSSSAIVLTTTVRRRRPTRVRQVRDRVEAAETERGREPYGHLRPFQDRHAHAWAVARLLTRDQATADPPDNRTW